jgi:hypothetical protein
MVRVSRAEVKIASAAPVATARPVEVAVSATGAIVARANAPTASVATGPRVQSAGLRPSRGANPTRIASNELWRNSRPTYPVRIDLARSK